MVDKKAQSSFMISALDGAAKIDHCPGIYISTPWMNSLHDLVFAIDCGFSLGEYSTALYSLTESISILKMTRNKLEIIKHGNRI